MRAHYSPWPLFFLRPKPKASVCLQHQSYRLPGQWPGRSVDRFQFQTASGLFFSSDSTRQRDTKILDKAAFGKSVHSNRKKKRTSPFELSLQISPGINHIEWTRQHQPPHETQINRHKCVGDPFVAQVIHRL